MSSPACDRSLWGCLLLPALALEVFTRAQDAHDSARPFAVSSGGHYPRIVAANDAALDRGLQCGQLVSAAYALAPDLVLRERDESGERAALAGIATWLTQFTPMVSLSPPHAVLIDIGSSVRLFGGLRPLVRSIESGIAALGYGVHTAWAPTPTAALLLARAGRTQPLTSHAVIEDALADIALSHVAGDEHGDAVALLDAAGVRTFGAARALPRAALARRVGAAFVDMLDRACAAVPDPRVPFVAPARYEGRLDLPAPIGDVEALGFAVNRLVHELAGWLLGRGLGVSELALTLQHERYVGVRTGVPATSVRFALATAAREPAHLIGVLRERLSRVALPAPVERIVLASEATAPLASRNLGLLPGDDAATAVPLLDRLRARLGDDAVIRVAPQAEHRPERAWMQIAAGERSRDPRRSAKGASARDGRRSGDSTSTRDARRSGDGTSARDPRRSGDSSSSRDPRRSGDATSPPAPPRPVWLLTEAQPLSATFEAKPWVLRDGPERIESGWWDGEDIRRDYYVAENPRGELLWIYRDSRYGDDAEWFLHGIFA